MTSSTFVKVVRVFFPLYLEAGCHRLAERAPTADDVLLTRTRIIPLDYTARCRF